MKRTSLIVSFLICQTLCLAQTIKSPIFDRSDVPALRVEKVEITPDTTYVYCTYHAEEHSWACLSDKTYLENTIDTTKYKIINIYGIPFSPQRREFQEAVDIQVIMSFPHISAKKINIIENDDNKSFNIYGIDLKNSYKQSYTDADIETYFKSAMENEEKENWNDAIDYLLKQFEASKYVYGTLSKETALPMYSLTMLYAHLGDYEKMIEWGKRAIEVLSTTPQDSLSLDVLARAYGNVGTAYAMLKQKENAEKFMELSLATRKRKGKYGELDYVIYLRDLATRYYYEGNYPKALLYGKEVTNFFKNRFKEDSQKYANPYVNSLNSLCEFYQRMDLFDKAIEIGKQAVDLMNNGACQDSPWLKLDACINLASALSSIGQTDDAISLLESVLNDPIISHTSNERALINAKLILADTFLSCKQDTTNAVKIYEDLLNTGNNSSSIRKLEYPEYSRVLSRLYHIYIDKDKDVGMDYLEKSIQVQKEWTGENSIDYANLLLLYVYHVYEDSIYDNENTDTLLYILRHASDIIKRHLNYSFYITSKAERNDYLNRYIRVFTWLIPTISGFLCTDVSNSLAYDASLFYKGLLLESDIHLKNLVLSSNDSTLIHFFDDYLQDISLLETQCSRGRTAVDIDSLVSTIKDKEFYISQKISRFNRLNKSTYYSWKEVKSHLKEKDVAIEIVSYQVGNSTRYDAYVINCESLAPLLIPLFIDDGKLKNHLLSGSIDYERLSKLIWGNKELEDALKGVKNVYISASGLLNIIGFEYLPIGNGLYIFDKYNIFRLSSTRELCYTNSVITESDVYLYGGLDYNTTKTMVNENKIHTNSKNDNYTNRLFRQIKDSLLKRGGFEPLIGSKQEIEQIKAELNHNNISYNVFTDAEGTEDSFKELSGKHASIIHLSTHGMYISDDDDQLAHKNNFQFIISSENPNIDEETQALTRSFLVMSGGNKLIQRDTITEGKEDGILTALEIAHLDFKDLDLVVLSACQTGLGRITSDGIYGLQRGFKKAGANTILMSLDKVDDEATRILMVEFYRNLMNGKTKRQSLQEAQQYLRKVENGKFDNPKYWASFIMLDGLN